MSKIRTLNKTTLCTLFPIKQKDGSILYYYCDFSEALGGAVYKGYQCTLKTPETTYLKPSRVKNEALDIDRTQAVAIKLYDGKQHPSPYQSYTSQRAVLNIEGRDIIIMDFLDGFHIYPDAHDNPKLKELTFFQAVDIAWHLILGLNHLHHNNSSGPAIVHGDVKGENIKIKINKIDHDGTKKYKTDVFYLDFDYAKPIINHLQAVQGTPEHMAIELLNGSYSESSDFFALSPILLSIFGAQNPFQKIFEFRKSHLGMAQEERIRKFREISFCSAGLFEHFVDKPDSDICELIKHLILQMGETNKNDRPPPNALLEFFTSLRQLCLVEEESSKEIYLLRLYIAAQDGSCLKDPKYQDLFFSLDKSLQDRLITLMNHKQCILLYEAAKKNTAASDMMDQLRKNIASYLVDQSHSLEQSSFVNSFFFSPITRKDIQWLLSCFEHQDHANYFACENKKLRKKLEKCTDPDLAPLISIVAEGMIENRLTTMKPINNSG